MFSRAGAAPRNTASLTLPRSMAHTEGTWAKEIRARGGDISMIYNVAQLLKAPTGTVQRVELDDADRLDLVDSGAKLAGPVSGTMRLHATNQAIFVRGTANMPA